MGAFSFSKVIIPGAVIVVLLCMISLNNLYTPETIHEIEEAVEEELLSTPAEVFSDEKSYRKILVSSIKKYEVEQFHIPLKKKPHSHRKVFFLGPNKTGTRTLMTFMRSIGYLSCHGVCANKSGRKGARIPWSATKGGDGEEVNYELVDNYESFSDEVSTNLIFSKLRDHYPSATFIWNTRNLRTWMVSRCNHVEENKVNLAIGKYKGNWLQNDTGDMYEWVKYRNQAFGDFQVDRSNNRLSGVGTAVVDVEEMTTLELYCTIGGAITGKEFVEGQNNSCDSFKDSNIEGVQRGKAERTPQKIACENKVDAFLKDFVDQSDWESKYEARLLKDL